MLMMKKKLFSLIFIFTISGSMAFAQGLAGSKTSFAILGGVNLQNLNGKDNGSKLENDMLIGLHAGLNAQVPIVPEFYFQPGLLFSTKGAKISETSYKLSYIELPLNFVYKTLVGNGYFMLGFGPYVAYGIGGKEIEFKKTVESGDSHAVKYIKPFDSGANLFFGYEFPAGLFMQLNTQLGLLDINPEDNRITGEDKSSLKNTGYGLSLGYRF
jgi:hypothetical protein